MRILVVEHTAQIEEFCGRTVDLFAVEDLDKLDVHVQLSGLPDYLEYVSSSDVILLGPGLSIKAPEIARNATLVKPSVRILMFVAPHHNCGITYRAAQFSGVRTIFLEATSALDLLEELYAINARLARESRTRQAKVIAVTQVSGGIGATTFSASLGEGLASKGKRTLLWDLDIETRDLSRFLGALDGKENPFDAWITNDLTLDASSLTRAIRIIQNNLELLTPPYGLAECLDLVCHIDGIAITREIMSLACAEYDAMIIDLNGRLGPSIGHILRLADHILVGVDDSPQSVGAIDLYLDQLRMLCGDLDRVSFICYGQSTRLNQIALELENKKKLGEWRWRLPPIPLDVTANTWSGSGKTTYALGDRSMRLVIDTIAQELGLIEFEKGRSSFNIEKIRYDAEKDRPSIGNHQSDRAQKNGVGSGRHHGLATAKDLFMRFRSQLKNLNPNQR